MTTETLESVDLKDYVVVLRGNGFEALGLLRARGEILSAVGWPYGRIPAMIESRYVGVAPYDLLNTMVECECGRKWLNEEIRNAHECPAIAAAKASAAKALKARAAMVQAHKSEGE